MAPTAHLDPLQAALQLTRSSYHWGSAIGSSPGTITFGFRLSAPSYNSSHNEQGTFSKLSADQMAAVELVMPRWASVANISFSEVAPGGYTNSATILFGNYVSEDDDAGAFAQFPYSNDQTFPSNQGDVWLNLNYSSIKTPTVGSYDFELIMHEVGHALGLEHPGNYNAGPGVTITYANDATYIEDSRQYSVMSYFDANATGANHVYKGSTIYSSTPLLYDIAATQRLYGPNTIYANADTTYGFGASDAAYAIADSDKQVVFCIWDGGGIDVLNVSEYSNDQYIDLREGKFSNVGALTMNVSIAIGAVIEWAVGGGGNDTIHGNDAGNVISGGAKDDTLIGAGGIDTFRVTEGHDTINDLGYGGRDVLTVSPGAIVDAVLQADWVASSLSYNLGTANIEANGRNVFLNEIPGSIVFGGSPGFNISNTAPLTIVLIPVTFVGSGFDDTLRGGLYDDVLSGGPGKDTITGGGGADRFIEQVGALGAPNTSSYDVITDFISTGSNATSDVLVLGNRTIATTIAGWTVSKGVASKAGSSLSAFLSAMAKTAVVAAYSDGTNTWVYDSESSSGTNQDVLVKLAGVHNFTEISSTNYSSTTIHISTIANTVSIDSQASKIAEGDSGSTGFVFSVNLATPAINQMMVDWQVEGSLFDVPAGADDFVGNVLPGGKVTFAVGETSKTITVDVAGDTIVEPDEAFYVNLFNAPADVALGTATAVATIENDDDGPIVAIAATDATKLEGKSGPTNFNFTVILDRPSATSQTLDWAVVASGASPAGPVDFGGTLPNGKVTFAAGETTKTLTVGVIGDTAGESDETFAVTLVNPSSGLSIGYGSAEGRILNDDGQTGINFTVAVSGVTFKYASSVQALIADAMYAGAEWAKYLKGHGTVDIAVDIVQIGGNTADGASVTSQFLYSENGVDVYQQGAVAELLRGVDPNGTDPDVRIRIDPDYVDTWLYLDPTPSPVSAVPVDMVDGVELFEHELGHSFAFNSYLDRSTGELTGTARAAFDAYITVVGGIAYFNGPQAMAVYGGPVPLWVNDLSHLGNKSGLPGSNLSEDIMYGPVGPLGKGPGLSVLDIAILNDCQALSGVFLTTGSLTQVEGSSGVKLFAFEVARTGDTTTLGSVSWSVTGTGANPAAGSDFTGGVLPQGVVSFGIGETSKTVTIDVSGDTVVEPDEDFTVTLSNPSANVVLGTATASGTIQNDDVLVSTVSIAALSAAKSEGNSGTTGLTFLVTLTGDTSVAHSVSYGVSGTGANPAAGSDFTSGVLPQGVVSFGIGETSKTVTIDVSGDTVVEPDEDFTVTLSNPSANVVLGTATASGTIQNDDVLVSTVSIAALSAAKSEGNSGTTGLTFLVTLTGDTSVAHTVSYGVTGTGANPAAGSDFTGGVLPFGVVSFGIGETSKTVTVDVAGDTVVELDESFVVTLSNPSANVVLGTATATGMIQNDDVLLSTVSIAALSAARTEGNSGTTGFTFTVTLTGDTSVSHTVSYGVAGTGANPASGSDFTGGVLPLGVVSFGIGETSKTVTVDVAGDAVVELDESFVVTLSNPSANVVVGTATASGTIQNDDVLVSTVSIAAQSTAKAEGTGGTKAFTFTVTTTGDSSTTRSVAWAVTGTGASKADAADFVGGVLPTGTLTFATGETSKELTITVNGDSTVEPDESFLVSLSNPSSSLKIGMGTASGTIQNDDSLPVTVTAHDDAYIVLEGQSLTIAAASGVLFNDQSASSASLLVNASHGAAQLAGTGAFTYTPAASFTGIDSFTYHAVPGGNGVDGKAVLYVVPVNVGASTTLDLLGLSADEQIAATYTAFFGRAADAGGHDFWVGEFVRGLPTQGAASPFANIASSFGISEEAKALYPFLVNPFNASDSQISAFLDSVYNNLFNRSSDAGGLAYWTGAIKATLQAGKFVGSVLVDIMSGAQDSEAGKDITTLMGKVAVGLAFVHEQQEHHTVWAGASDVAAATSLLEPVAADPLSILVGVRNAEAIIAAHA